MRILGKTCRSQPKRTVLNMKKIVKLKICNCCLPVLVVAMLISGIQLEATHCSGQISVWIHIAIGLIMMYAVAYHIFLHFGRTNWFAKFHKQKSPVTRMLWWMSVVTMITGIVAMIHWTQTMLHTPVGGLHGKLGFIMVVLSIGHLSKRIKFYKKLV